MPEFNYRPAELADFLKFAAKSLKGEHGALANVHAEIDEAGALRITMTDGYIMVSRAFEARPETYPAWRQVIPAEKPGPYATARLSAKALQDAAAAAPKAGRHPGMPGDGALLTWTDNGGHVIFTSGPITIMIEGVTIGNGRVMLSARLLRAVLEGTIPETDGMITLGLTGLPPVDRGHQMPVTITGLRPDDVALIMPIRE